MEAQKQRAPSIPWLHESPLHKLDGTAFRNMLREVGGTPPEILENADVMSLFEPILRNDFRISETYHRAIAIPLSMPILAIHARKDFLIRESDVAAWRAYAPQSFTMEIVDEGHMLSRVAMLEVPQRVARCW